MPCRARSRRASTRETLGVNSRRSSRSSSGIYQREHAERLLSRASRLADPARIDVRGELTCGRDVSIDVNCVFEGEVTLGRRREIGANCVLRNVSIGAGTSIEPFTTIEDASVGARCRIGPFARLRPGTRACRGRAHRQLRRSEGEPIAARSKANHLAYIGDCTVGRNVNIGAGTITCNYDGADKHRTIIEDDVHIGSDMQLVAPVTVGAGHDRRRRARRSGRTCRPAGWS